MIAAMSSTTPGIRRLGVVAGGFADILLFRLGPQRGSFTEK